MDIYQPYTYLLKFKPTGQTYYGSSYANNKSKVAHPTQLWVTYFTSSKVIKKLIEEYGADSFDVQIRKTFLTAKHTLIWEHKVLTRLNAVKDKKWLNRTNGNKLFYLDDNARARLSASKKGYIASEETRKKLSDIHANRSDEEKIAIKVKASKSLSGRTQSTETKAKISKSHIGRKFTEEHKQKIREARQNKPGNRTGKKASLETLEKMRNAALKWHAENPRI